MKFGPGRLVLIPAVLLLTLLTSPLASSPALAQPRGEAARSLAALAVQQAALRPTDGRTFDRFGFSVAVSRDTAVVGAPRLRLGLSPAQGVVYVFTRSAGSWSLQQELTDGEARAGNQFGSAVAVDGDTLVVGAPDMILHADEYGTDMRQGAAYVFARSGSVWKMQARLVASDGAAEDRFGCAVALSGSTAVVGATQDWRAAPNNRGVVYVFTRSGTAWSQSQKLTALGGAADDCFGCAVSLSGTTLAVGAWGKSGGETPRLSAYGRGAVYVFTRPASAWVQQQELAPAGGVGLEAFGSSVAVSADTLVAGAPGNGLLPGYTNGAAYVFTRSGATWTQQARLTDPGGSGSERFGSSVAVAGDVAVVGATYANLAADRGGRAFIFSRSASAWSLSQPLSTAAGWDFGQAVALDGTTLLVGAPGVTGAAAGSAYVYVLR